MSKIIATNLSLKFPIYGANTRSLKRSIINIATGKSRKIEDQSNTIKFINALTDIGFELRDGDRLGLIGHNGAGKSTLLKVLSGIYIQSSGTLKIEGSVSSLLSPTVGMQPDATGYENIKIRSLMMEWDKKKTQEIVEDIEEFTDLSDFLKLQVKTYSSGMHLRLAFAMATAISPDILLIDEVIGAGDAQFLQKAHKRMNDLINSSNILILASHSNDIIQKFCNKVMWLDHGKIKAYGETKEIIASYESACGIA